MLLQLNKNKSEGKEPMLASYDWVIVEKIVREKTSGGLYLPQVQKGNTLIGKVVSTGIGKIEDVVETLDEDGAPEKRPLFVSTIFEVGDTVVSLDDWAFHFVVNDKTYMAIKAENIFCKLQPE